MEIPVAFERLAATRGTDAEGAVPRDTKIIFAIGGYAYRWEQGCVIVLTREVKAKAFKNIPEILLTWKSLQRFQVKANPFDII